MMRNSETFTLSGRQNKVLRRERRDRVATDNGCVVSKLQAGRHNAMHRGVRACTVYDYARVFVYVPSPIQLAQLSLLCQAMVYTENGVHRRVSTVRPCIQSPRGRFLGIHQFEPLQVPVHYAARALDIRAKISPLSSISTAHSVYFDLCEAVGY